MFEVSAIVVPDVLSCSSGFETVDFGDMDWFPSGESNVVFETSSIDGGESWLTRPKILNYILILSITFMSHKL